jgi:hypothetical protein
MAEWIQKLPLADPDASVTVLVRGMVRIHTFAGMPRAAKLGVTDE